MSLNFGTIMKRERNRSCIVDENVKTTHESVIKMNITNLENAINMELNKDSGIKQINPHLIHEAKITPVIERYCGNFIDSIDDYQNAGRFIDEAVIFIGEINKINESYADTYTNNIISRIIPKMDTTNLSRVEYRLNESEFEELTESQINKILSCVKENIVVDRILDNHNKISKRFNIESEIAQYNSKGLARTVESVCDIVNTYKIEPYQKLNVCIEEMFYLLNKQGYKYNSKELVREALEDIIISNNLDLHTLKGYRKALKESYVLETEGKSESLYKNTDLELVSRFVDENYNFTPSEIGGYIDNFLMNPEKGYASLMSLCVKIGKDARIIDIENNLDKLIFLLRKCCVMDIVDENGIHDCINCLINAIVNRGDMDIARTDKIINTLRSCLDDRRFTPYKITGDESKSCCIKNNCLNQAIPALNSTKNLYYDSANLEAMKFFSNEPKQVALQEFKIFKFNNLIKAAFNLDKYLKIKGRRLMNKPKTKLKRFIVKARNVLFGESTDEAINHIGAYLTEDNIPDICVAIYEYNNESEEDVKEFLSEVCKGFNDTLLIENNNDMKSYYIMNPGTAEIHIRENIQVICKEDESIEKELSFEESYYANMFSDVVELMEDASINHINSIEEFITEFCNHPDFGLEELEIALEAMSIIGADIADVKTLKSTYNSSRTRFTNESTNLLYPDKKDVDELVYEIVDQDLVSEIDKLEAYNILGALLETTPDMKKPKVGAAYWDDDDEDDEDDETENIKDSKKSENKDDKKESKEDSSNIKDEISAKASKKKFGVNLNDLKLALEGMKKKFKDLGQKEQEMVKNFDNTSRILVKGLKDAMISDRREAIIKGSIIPSFSKCIKIAIGLAGVAKFIDPGLAVIAAIGGFAVSKHLTHKERILLLDDIEVELDVLEKEISLAESRNQINKYRELQKYKKDLQRQYQRIKYNVRVGKDILPGSTVGVKKFD